MSTCDIGGAQLACVARIYHGDCCTCISIASTLFKYIRQVGARMTPSALLMAPQCYKILAGMHAMADPTDLLSDHSLSR